MSIPPPPRSPFQYLIWGSAALILLLVITCGGFLWYAFKQMPLPFDLAEASQDAQNHYAAGDIEGMWAALERYRSLSRREDSPSLTIPFSHLSALMVFSDDLDTLADLIDWTESASSELDADLSYHFFHASALLELERGNPDGALSILTEGAELIGETLTVSALLLAVHLGDCERVETLHRLLEENAEVAPFARRGESMMTARFAQLAAETCRDSNAFDPVAIAEAEDAYVSYHEEHGLDPAFDTGFGLAGLVPALLLASSESADATLEWLYRLDHSNYQTLVTLQELEASPTTRFVYVPSTRLAEPLLRDILEVLSERHGPDSEEADEVRFVLMRFQMVGARREAYNSLRDQLAHRHDVSEWPSWTEY